MNESIKKKHQLADRLFWNWMNLKCGGEFNAPAMFEFFDHQEIFITLEEKDGYLWKIEYYWPEERIVLNIEDTPHEAELTAFSNAFHILEDKLTKKATFFTE